MEDRAVCTVLTWRMDVVRLGEGERLRRRCAVQRGQNTEIRKYRRDDRRICIFTNNTGDKYGHNENILFGRCFSPLEIPASVVMLGPHHTPAPDPAFVPVGEHES